MDLSFNAAVELFLEKVYAKTQDQDYYSAVDTILYLWDQDRADQLNKAILPSSMYEDVEDGELYLLVRVVPLRYLHLKRDKNVQVIQYDS